MEELKRLIGMVIPQGGDDGFVSGQTNSQGKLLITTLEVQKCIL